jgi:lysophospholipase L1-like esterase
VARAWLRPPRRLPRWMPLLAGLLAASLLTFGGLLAAWSIAYVRGLAGLRPAVPDVQLLPAPVGGHPSKDRAWFLVVGDSISAGITPTTLGDGPNPSWVADLAGRLASSGHAWVPDDLACPTESTVTYSTGCKLDFTNPLLGGRPQRAVALEDVRAHRSTLRFMVVELGANDLLGMTRAGFAGEADAALGRLATIIAELQRSAPGVPLLVANVYDPYAGGPDPYAAQIAYFDGILAVMAGSTGAHLIDFADAMAPGGMTTRAQICKLVECQGDGVHPTPAGGDALAGAAFDAIQAAGLLAPPL